MGKETGEKGSSDLSLITWLPKAARGPFLVRLLGPGRLLSLDLKRRMEAIFGRDLSEVRIHDTRQAGEMASRMSAEAFVVGPRVFTSPGRLGTEAPRELALLAHELTHVIQQTGPGRVGMVHPEPVHGPSPVLAPGFLAPAQAGFPIGQPVPTRLQTRLAAGGTVGYDALEAEALGVEQSVQAMAETVGEEANGPGRIDPRDLADRVYRLMRDDLRLERERRAF